VQPDELDQRADLRLGAAQQQRAALRAEPLGEHREVDHQRGIGEHELGQIDDYIGLRAERARQSWPASSLCRPILIPAASQNRRFFIEIDDFTNLPKVTCLAQAILRQFRRLRR
jgi:hypothetical protein